MGAASRRLLVVVVLEFSIAGVATMSFAADPLPPLARPKGTVELLRDRWGVPHVFAESDAGAMYGLGQAVAEDRGFQMHYNLRMMQGRLAEISGEPLPDSKAKSPLANDRRMRTFGYYRAAQSMAARLDPETKTLLAAYSAGVNDWFESHPAQQHPLFAKVGLRPEPWSPADCIASWWHLGQFFAGDGLGDLENYKVLSSGKKLVPAVNLIYDDSASVVGREDVSPEWIARVKRFQAEHLHAPAPPDGGPEGPKFSHAWVVGGKKTTTGAAVLVSDPQTPVTNPALFYEFHLSSPGFNVRGVGVPGSPGILIGFNENFAWGVTALGADQADLFRLKTDVAHPNQYLLDGQWRDMEVRRETIQVKNADPVELTVRQTTFGPVVSAFVTTVEGDPEVALKRVPLCATETETIQGSLMMMRAADLETFTRGLAIWQFPSVNMLFGDREGNVGYWVQAAMPLRSRLDPHFGAAAHDGSDSKYDWQGFVPHDLLPHTINPPRGWVASGNHRPVASFYPMFLGSGKGSNGHGLRSWRLYERLTAQASFQPTDVLDIHFDDVNPFRRDVLLVGLHIRDQLKTPLSKDAAAALKHLEPWYQHGAHSDMRIGGAGLAEEIQFEFRHHTTPLAATFGGGQAGLVKFLVDLKARIANASAASLTEDELRLFDGILASAWKSAQKKYGADSTLWDEQARAAVIARSRGYHDGMSGFGSLDASFDLKTPPLTCIDGSTIKSSGSQGYTQYVPLHDVDAAQTLLPPGQSERVDSPYRISNWKLWETGSLHPAPLSRAAVERISTSTTDITPGQTAGGR